MKHSFDAEECLKKIRHYLPSQAPLKDFVHHNTLHAFEDYPFFNALQNSSEVFGYKTSLSLTEYRKLYNDGKISDRAISISLEEESFQESKEQLRELMFSLSQPIEFNKEIGRLRALWKTVFHLDMDSSAHINLFRLIGAYLDQGISATIFPAGNNGFLQGVRTLDQSSHFKFFKSSRTRELLFDPELNLSTLLTIVVGDEKYFEQYLFDQQFAHPGWSGMVSVIEQNPSLLYDHRDVSLHDFICVELLLEIDKMDRSFGEEMWKPLSFYYDEKPIDFLQNRQLSELWMVKSLWQKSYEWTYYDQLLTGLNQVASVEVNQKPSFQALFCIDDREESIRRQIELLVPNCQTFGTPAHFNLPIYYRPSGGKFNTQVCPGVIDPEHIILDKSTSEKHDRDLHFHQSSHNFFSGWMISQTVGFWSALKLFINVFKPTISPGHSSSLSHMSHRSQLIIENVDGKIENGLKVGFNFSEMCNIVLSELKRIGLTDNFASIVYLFGHGGSSTNNPYYAGYNCGACSGKPSSLNARVFASIANRSDIRVYLSENGISIPDTTQFIGGLHDTTRDEFSFYDVENLTQENIDFHEKNVKIFNAALSKNAKERARQFVSINIRQDDKEVHKEVKRRSVALFEPRPELNHSNNCLCIVGDRKLTKGLFLDQRAFLNSYDWRQDTSGSSLEAILNAATPVCGGINLEYYFSRVDNENFGAGSKLPHNVIGLFGVVNGIEGDLRTGLPLQMIEVHDPLRLMMVVEQKPDFVLEVLRRNEKTYRWYRNDWLKLAVIDPESKEVFVFRNDAFHKYEVAKTPIDVIEDIEALFESSHENLPVLKLL